MAGRRYGDWDNENEERLEREAERRRLEAEQKAAAAAAAEQAQTESKQEVTTPPTRPEVKASYKTTEREVVIDHAVPEPELKQNPGEMPYRIFEGANGQFSFFEIHMPGGKGRRIIRTSRPYDDAENESV